MAKKTFVTRETLIDLLQDADTSKPGKPHRVRLLDEVRYVWAKSVADARRGAIENLGIEVEVVPTAEIVEAVKELNTVS